MCLRMSIHFRMAETVRIDPKAHAILREIASATDLSLTEVLSRAVEEYRRKVFLEGLAKDFAALRSDRESWSEELAQRQAWDATLADEAGE